MNKDRNIIEITPVAVVRSAFPKKFGLPRQSGIVKDIKAEIIFNPEYRDISAVRGLEEFSHIWLIWYFSENERKKWSPTVRPPRLGGNKRVGVFATRSPFRPNPIGLSLVKLEKIEIDEKSGPILHISGADIVDKTPIFDIKPYLTYSDSCFEAKSGFADRVKDYSLNVEFSDSAADSLPPELFNLFSEILSQDPRPSYQNDPDRIYSFEMYGYNISFSVRGETLTVKNIEKLSDE